MNATKTLNHERIKPHQLWAMPTPKTYQNLAPLGLEGSYLSYFGFSKSPTCSHLEYKSRKAWDIAVLRIDDTTEHCVPLRTP
jgi:hypothetical protein